MFCKLHTYCLNGIDPISVTVEIDLADGLPGFDIVGLPDSAVKESRDRVRSALKNSGFEFPIKRITINLAPADVRKEGSLYDLPIALGILCCMGFLKQSDLDHRFFAAELSLDGYLRKVRGLVPMLCQMTSDQLLEAIVPFENVEDLLVLPHTSIIYCDHLHQVLNYLIKEVIPPPPAISHPLPLVHYEDFLDVKGQEPAKKGLMVAAAGHHNTLLIGPPGSGKTMLAKRIPAILPPLTPEESLEITKIYSITNKAHHSPLLRPFRSPHHTLSLRGLIGGGAHPQPGEITLAHHGVLFLDELLEFNRLALDTLRQPLEEGSITLSRVHHTLTYPSKFILIAATNPCPCGYYPDFTKCTCDFHQIKRYLSKLSGPLLDRIDLQLETSPLEVSAFSVLDGLSTSQMHEKVMDAHAIQHARYKDTPINYNSDLPTNQISYYCSLTLEAETLLNDWFTRCSATARSYQRILKLARTIADLKHLSMIDAISLSEAINYRMLDRKFLHN